MFSSFTHFNVHSWQRKIKAIYFSFARSDGNIMMHKSARVSPKNLQFRDTVQIKEIPNNDEIYHSAKRASWDPDLNNVRRSLFFINQPVLLLERCIQTRTNKSAKCNYWICYLWCCACSYCYCHYIGCSIQSKK